MLECWERFDRLMSKSKGMSYRKLTKLIDVSFSQFYAWKRNDTIPPADLTQKFCDIMGVSVRWFLTGDDKADGKLNAMTDPVFSELASDKDAYDFAYRYMLLTPSQRRMLNDMCDSWGVRKEPMEKLG